MQHLPGDLLARFALRAEICAHCYQRPPGSEHLTAHDARSCEATCPLFAHVRPLHELARQEIEPEPGAADHAVRELICTHCHANPTAGEYCACYLSRTCPLSCYAARAMEVLAKVPMSEKA